MSCFVFSFIAQAPPEAACKAKADIAFILDSSGSLRNDYDKEKAFLNSLATTFGISNDGARAGVVTFSYNSEHTIKLNDHNDISSFADAVNKIPLMGSTTRIDKALRLTQKEMFTLQNGGRPGVNRLVFVLTDGSQTQDADAEDPGAVAEELRNSGIRLITVGIGKGVNKTELARIAGDAKDVFSAATFDELISYDFLSELNKAGCAKGM